MEKVNLAKIDFRYSGVSIDYSTETSCSESGCDSICRCGVIVDKRVESVDVSEVADTIYDLYFPNSKHQVRDDKLNSILYGTSRELNTYCIDRVLRVHKIWENDYWEINTTGGYYGEEIGDTVMSYPNVMQREIEEVLSLNTIKEKIDYILKLEYGHLLPELQNVDYELVDIGIDDVIFGSVGHYKKIQTENVDHYIDISYSGIRGVVKRDGPKYKIIDGYHRIYAAGLGKINKSTIRVILVKND